MESSSSDARILYDVIVTDNDLLDADKSKYIIKMHGDISNRDSIVLKEQDYLEYSQTHVLIELFVKALITEHIFLFLGYSLNDYNVKLILSWINHLRSEKKGTIKNRYLGYIVLDEESIEKKIVTYFRKNGIRVININRLPLIKDIPSGLSNPKGQRLYSFLKLLANPVLQIHSFPDLYMEEIVDFLEKHRICDHSILLSKLCIRPYEVVRTNLILYDKDQFDRLESFFENKTQYAERLQQIFANCEIKTIWNKPSGVDTKLEIKKENELFVDLMYSAYIQDDYLKLSEMCETESDGTKILFYHHFISGYDDIQEEDIKQIKLSDSFRETLIQMHNMQVFQLNTQHKANFTGIIHFVDNISSVSVKQAYQQFKEICSGSNIRKLKMTEALDELKDNIQDKTTIFLGGGGGSVSAIYKIQKEAISHYLFYFMNSLFSVGIKDVSSIFHIYIEGIICANSEAAERPYTKDGYETNNHKYEVTPLDIDIITKYIDTKELNTLLTEYNVMSFCISKEVIEHTVLCVTNLVNSITSIKAYGYRDKNLSVLCNLLLLLQRMKTTQEEKNILSESIQKLFSDDVFNKHIWNMYSYQNGFIMALAKICGMLPDIQNIACVKSIIYTGNFFEAVQDGSIYKTREIIEGFLKNTGKQDERELVEIIDGEDEFAKKIVLLRLLHRKIKTRKAIEKYRRFLEEHFTELNTQSIYDFVFDKWLIPSEQDLSFLMSSLLSMKRDKVKGIAFFPDASRSKLECIIILYLAGYTKDITCLEELCNEDSHLKFLLHPNSFDYSNVDFSDYMWVNFARNQNLMQHFVDHREAIIPRLNDHIVKGEATETERKILYGYLLKQNEIWQEENDS